MASHRTLVEYATRNTKHVPPCFENLAISEEVWHHWMQFCMVCGALFIAVGVCLLDKLRRYRTTIRSRVAFRHAARVRFWIASVLVALLEGLLAFDGSGRALDLTALGAALMEVASTSLLIASYVSLLDSLTRISRHMDAPAAWLSQFRSRLATATFCWLLFLYVLGEQPWTLRQCFWCGSIRKFSEALLGLSGAWLLSSQKTKIISELARAAAMTSPRIHTEGETSPIAGSGARSTIAGVEMIRSFTRSSLALPSMRHGEASPLADVDDHSSEARLQQALRTSPLLRYFMLRLQALEILLFAAFVSGIANAGLYIVAACAENSTASSMTAAHLVSVSIDRVLRLCALFMALLAYRDHDPSSLRGRTLRRSVTNSASMRSPVRRTLTGSPIALRQSHDSSSLATTSLSSAKVVTASTQDCQILELMTRDVDDDINLVDFDDQRDRSDALAICAE